MEYTVLDLLDGYYLVETKTQYIIYKYIYDIDRKKIWKGYKKDIDSMEEAVGIWRASLN